MALTLAQSAFLGTNALFSGRVYLAMVQYAVTVGTEVQGSATRSVWAKRRQLSARILNDPSVMLVPFTRAVASDPAAVLTWYNPIGILSTAPTTPMVVQTAAAHGLTTGQVVDIVSAIDITANGTWIVTVTASDTFTIPVVPIGTGGAVGTVQRAETDANLKTVLMSVFNPIAGITPDEEA